MSRPTNSPLAQHFARPLLAKQLAEELLGRVPLSDAPNGLFLSAPRRTGKSEFLQQDLKPELEKQGALVVYVDLWSDKKRSPMDLIASGLAAVVQNNLSLFKNLAQTMKGVNVAGVGVTFDTSKIGKIDGLTLPQALMVVREQTKKPIALMVDEAQHALVSEDGEMAMSALKSARDQLRDIYAPQGEVGLMLVMSGSHRDKLVHLLDTPATPFWGSKVKRLPALGESFVALQADKLKRLHPALLSIDAGALLPIFDICGRQPQAFINMLSASFGYDMEEAGAVASWQGDAQTFMKNLQDRADVFQSEQRNSITRAFTSLALPQQAVLARLLEMGDKFKPYDAAALTFYEQFSKLKMTATKVQKILEALSQSEPPHLWRSLRGEYSLYDQEMTKWFTELTGKGEWPPKKAADVADPASDKLG